MTAHELVRMAIKVDVCTSILKLFCDSVEGEISTLALNEFRSAVQSLEDAAFTLREQARFKK